MTAYKKRVLALDVGEKRIGVAVSDPLGFSAQGVETIFTKGLENDLKRIRELSDRYETKRLLVGLPRNMNGTIGPQAERIMEFSRALTGAGFEVRHQDERMTTMMANRVLLEGEVRREKRREVVDKLAATYILQSFLDGGGWPSDEPGGPDE
jgi:putative Holliday junction resolvase